MPAVERDRGASHRRGGPAGPAALSGAVGILVPAGDQHAVAEADEQRGQQRQCREGHGDDREDHPECHGTEHHDRHDEHRGERQDHGQRGEEHRLARGGECRGDAVERVLAVFALLAVAGDDEQAVVDADRKADHHREVHGPHRHRGDVGQEVEGAEPHRDAGDRQQQRDARGERGTERDEQQDDRGEPGHELREVQGALVRGVEVAPHGPLTGDLGLRSRWERDVVDVVDQLLGRLGSLRVAHGLEPDRDQGGAAIG